MNSFLELAKHYNASGQPIENVEPKWNKRFINLAYHISDWSKDPTTKVGAVIVDTKRRIISMGYNGFPRGVDDSPERYEDRLAKLLFVCHAERNALDNAATSVENCFMYSTLIPCNECAKSIVQRGISKVYTPELVGDTSVLRKKFNLDYSEKIFSESGVELIYL